MAKKLICIFCSVIFILSLAGCLKNEKLNEPSTAQTTDNIYTSTQDSPTQAVQSTGATQASASEIIITDAISETAKPIIPDTVPAPSDIPDTTASTTSVQTTKTLEKTGEMAFSDDADNRYIAAIASKYGVNAESLVALYTVPENDSNIVLQFDGTKNDDGSLVRNKDTLIAIYSIDKALNSKRASEDSSLNEYSYGEMKVMFFSTTTYIMPEFKELR